MTCSLTFWQKTACSSNPNAPRSLEIRFGGQRELCRRRDSHATSSSRYVLGPGLSICVHDLVFRQVARWRSSSLFSPHHGRPRYVSEGTIRDHGLLHDRLLPPVVGCNPILSLINVPKACAAWRSDLGGVPLPYVYQLPMPVYYKSKPSDSN